MKKYFRNYSFVLVLFLLCSIFLSACIFDDNTQKYEASGTIYFNSVELENVSIKSSAKLLYTTKQDGKFNISVQKDTVIYPEKEGYIFNPSQITITENTKDIIFVAEKIELLNGSITLDEIIITPTSISNFGENYSYNYNNESALKISQFEVIINNKTINAVKSTYFYATKDKPNTLTIDDDVTLQTGENITIKFKLNAYFMYGNEQIYQEVKQTLLEIKEQQTTNDLTSQNQIEYTVSGVNSNNTKFTYNVTFVFDYYPTI